MDDGNDVTEQEAGSVPEPADAPRPAGMPVPAKGKAPLSQSTEELPVVGRASSLEVDDFDDWDEDEDLERTRRYDAASRAKARRVTGVLALVAALGLGFLGGVLYQKNEGTSSNTALGAGAGAGGFAALRAAFAGSGASGSGASDTGSSARSGSSSSGLPTGGFGGFASRFGGGNSVVGTVSAVAGGTLYVSQGTSSALTKVVTGPASTVKVSADGSVDDIQPGDTVIISGAKQSDGSYMAATITDSGASSTSTPAG